MNAVKIENVRGRIPALYLKDNVNQLTAWGVCLQHALKVVRDLAFLSLTLSRRLIRVLRLD
ncbi:MAG: hypothetical protein H0U81_02775 [Pyrinomonadaceae bacterium]|nr:hypothetical protein [Pyrinomonadaceae bacterium]